MENYTFRAQYSPQDGEYLATCIEFPQETARAPTAHQAVAGIERTVEEVCAEMLRDEADPPASISDRRFSGSFVVRTSPELHGRLVLEARNRV